MQTSRNKSQYKGVKHFIYSSKYSLEGIIYGYKNEMSLQLHGILSIIAIILGIVFKINLIEWSMLLISLGAILFIELLNTAIEAVVDMITIEFNPLAKIAKDCGSGATYIATIIAIAIAAFIFIPKIIILF